MKRIFFLGAVGLGLALKYLKPSRKKPPTPKVEIERFIIPGAPKLTKIVIPDLIDRYERFTIRIEQSQSPVKPIKINVVFTIGDPVTRRKFFTWSDSTLHGFFVDVSPEADPLFYRKFQNAVSTPGRYRLNVSGFIGDIDHPSFGRKIYSANKDIIID